MGTTETNIVLSQAPVIKHQLSIVGQQVDERINELNLDNLVATEDTIKSMKQLRADLNKEYKEFETQRKTVKELVFTPYNAMESEYKVQIAEKYKNATDILKTKIEKFENKVKSDREELLKEYFDELITSEKIDFITFAHTGIEVKLSISQKKYKEQILAFVEQIKDDLTLINTQEFKTEIFVEYKKDLNVSKAITTVSTRKEAERKERERLAELKLQRRGTLLVEKCNMLFKDLFQAWEMITDKSQIVTLDFVKTATDDEFNSKVEELKEHKEKVYQQMNGNEQRAEPLNAPKVENLPPTPKPAPQPTEVKSEQPKAEKQILTARFEVKGTLEIEL